MAAYKYSTQANGSNIAFTTADTITIDNDLIGASDLSIAGNVITISSTSPAKSITVTVTDPTTIATSSFIFADGSKIIVGDGLATTLLDSADNYITGTDFDDYLDGLTNAALGDTVSYGTALSGVTVDLSVTTAQDTIGAGVDKILNIENIFGSAYNDILTGDSNANFIDGGAAGNDVLTGGGGNDTYVVSSGDTVVEASGTLTGTDLVRSSVDYTLGANLENLTLLGSAIFGTGNSDNNTITGNTNGNVIDGGTGSDTLIGGTGNDTYYVNTSSDTVSEAASAGTDMIFSTATITALAANVENLRLFGTNLNATGNALDNVIYATKNNNTLDGSTHGAAGDTLSYRYGAAKGVTVDLTVTTAQATGGSGSDTISNFENIIGSIYGDTLTAATAAGSKVDGGSGNDKLTGTDDILIGGIGNDTYNVVGTGNTISDSAGVDTIISTGTLSINSLASIENLTLNISTAPAATGTGNNLANILTATISGAGTSIALLGGTGDDTYVVNTTGVTVTELASAGTDTVQSKVDFTLGNNIENLTLLVAGSTATNGTGNALANTITANNLGNTLTGNAGNDTLVGGTGGDRLDGGADSDNMKGGNGNDTYVVNTLTDIVTEVSGVSTGTDKVESAVSYTLASNVENLELTGTALNATGNSAVNALVGNAQANILNGGAGGDSMSGGDGNDTYIVDSNSVATGTDTITEASTGGTADVVQSSVTYTLGSEVENLTLIATAANGTGNSAVNTLTGNTSANTLSGLAGDDTLIGGQGKDTLTGGTDNDTFVFNASNETTFASPDTITDFTQAADSANSDIIDLGTIFGATTVTFVALSGGAFSGGGNASVKYAASGSNTLVSGDVNGDGSADFAITLTGAYTLVASDFDFVG